MEVNISIESINSLTESFLGGVRNLMSGQSDLGDLGRQGLGALGGLGGLAIGTKGLSGLAAYRNEIMQISKALTGKAVDVTAASFEASLQIAKYGKGFYDSYQDAFGGMQNIYNIQNQTTKAQKEAYDAITGVYLDNKNEFNELINRFQVDTATNVVKEVNALRAYFDIDEVTQNYSKTFDSLRYTQTLRMNELSKDQVVMLGTFAKGFQVENRKITELLDRTIALTGKASIDTFLEISHLSKAVSDETGVDYKNIAQMVIELRTDVEKFGNVHNDAAARIAGALNQMGVSYQGFGGMIGRFQGFDSAASSLGNLTTLFGVHFDAMEMMMLANEDQEEFLYRMREAFLDTGRSIDDMTLAEKRLASQELGMGITDFENFMRGERELTDLRSATSTAQQKDLSKGLEVMTQQMSLIQQDADSAQKYLRDQFFHNIREDAYLTGQNLATLFDGLLARAPEVFGSIRAEVQQMGGLALSTDAGSMKITEENFETIIEGMRDEIADKGAVNNLLNKLKKGADLERYFLEDFIADNRISQQDRSVLRQALNRAQLQTSKQVGLLLDKQKATMAPGGDLFKAYEDNKALLAAQGMMLATEDFTKTRFEYSLDVQSAQKKTAAVAKLEETITAYEISGTEQQKEIVNELKIFLAELKKAPVQSGPTTFIIETTADESVRLTKVAKDQSLGLGGGRKVVSFNGD